MLAAKQTSKLWFTETFERYKPVIGGFPSKGRGNVEYFSMSWYHHVYGVFYVWIEFFETGYSNQWSGIAEYNHTINNMVSETKS